MITDEMIKAAMKEASATAMSYDYTHSKIAMKAAIEAALAAMPKPEPVGCVSEMPGSNGGFTMAVFRATDVPLGSNLYLAPPSPAVIVKPLEWRNEPIPPSGETLAMSCVGLYCIPHSGDRFYLKFRDTKTIGDYSTLDKAKAAAQRDYETRILSVLET